MYVKIHKFHYTYKIKVNNYSEQKLSNKNKNLKALDSGLRPYLAENSLHREDESVNVAYRKIAVCSETHMEHINKMPVKTQKVLMLRLVVNIVTNGL
jgi:hypothetical protein